MPTSASVRAVLQLAVVAAALRGVSAASGSAALVLAVVFSVATRTAARRLRGCCPGGHPIRRLGTNASRTRTERAGEAALPQPPRPRPVGC